MILWWLVGLEDLRGLFPPKQFHGFKPVSQLSMSGMVEPEHQPASGWVGHSAESREQPAFGTVKCIYTARE